MNALHSASEEWMDISIAPTKYEISSFGNIRNKLTGKILAKNKMGAGYIKADVWVDGVRTQTSVHRLVAEAFIKNTGLPEVNHKDGDKTNNRVSNLEWSGRSENVKHSYYSLGNTVKPVTATEVSSGEKRSFSSIAEAERHGFSSTLICRVLKGRFTTYRGFTWEYTNKGVINE